MRHCGLFYSTSARSIGELIFYKSVLKHQPDESISLAGPLRCKSRFQVHQAWNQVGENPSDGVRESGAAYSDQQEVKSKRVKISGAFTQDGIKPYLEVHGGSLTTILPEHIHTVYCFLVNKPRVSSIIHMVECMNQAALCGNSYESSQTIL